MTIIRETYRSVMRFAGSGIVITATSLSITTIGIACGLGRPVSVALGYAISSILGYFLHSLVSFRDSLNGRLAPISTYTIILIISSFIAYLGGYASRYLLGGGLISLGVAILLPVAVNYLLWRLLLLRR